MNLTKYSQPYSHFGITFLNRKRRNGGSLCIKHESTDSITLYYTKSHSILAYHMVSHLIIPMHYLMSLRCIYRYLLPSASEAAPLGSTHMAAPAHYSRQYQSPDRAPSLVVLNLDFWSLCVSKSGGLRYACRVSGRDIRCFYL